MAKERQQQIITQPETQNTVMILEENVGNSGSGEVSNPRSLPHDIIINDILTRVPVDSLMRFKCVCKFWLHLFSNDSDFMKLYSRQNVSHGFVELSPSNPDDDACSSREGCMAHLIRKVMKSNGIVSYNIGKKEKKVYSYFRPETGLVNRKLVIQHSLNGLVLLSRQEYDDECYTHHVFNPITGYSVELPVLKDFTGRGYFHLVYDAAAEKYKVVCLYKRRPIANFRFKIVTLGVKSCSWRKVVALSDPRLEKDYEAVFANGSLNWLTHDRYGCGNKSEGKILSLNVSEEKFYTIDYPKGVSDEDKGLSDVSKLMEMGGSLCFFDYVSTGRIKLWVLKENEEKQRKQSQHNEWLEYNVDLLQNNNVPPELFNDFKNYRCVGLVKNPTLMILLRTKILRVLDEPDERGSISYYIPVIYSYDVELKTFAFVCEHEGRTFVKWDLSSLLNFQSTFADLKIMHGSWKLEAGTL